MARPSGEAKPSGAFLLIRDENLKAGDTYRISVKYGGGIIRQPSEKTYLVNDRNTWYPYSGNLLTTFDLSFRCPEQLSVISTGELISQTVSNGIRTVHRKTAQAQALAGFNVGRYESASLESGPYRVESYSNASHLDQAEDIAKQTGEILTFYSNCWGVLPLHSIAVSPVPGYFGQGFPGLIYLSDVSYMPLQSRPAVLRSPRMDAFFSSMLLPHEVAHQWWGNLLVSEDYRSAWLIEAMANDSALQYLARTQGEEAAASVLEQYRQDLAGFVNGKLLESAGPLDFGIRLLDSSGLRGWHAVTYEKGTWILHMLRERMGPENFRLLQAHLLKTFSTKAITNEEFREAAAKFIPAGQPDRDLRLFFDTWVYSTGIPHLEVRSSSEGWGFQVSQVEQDFTVDLPISCTHKNGKVQTEWVRAIAGENLVAAGKTAACSLPAAGAFLFLR